MIEKRHGMAWLPKEDDTIRQMIGGGRGTRAISHMLGRSEEAIKKRMGALGISRNIATSDYLTVARAIRSQNAVLSGTAHTCPERASAAFERAYIKAAKRNGWMVQPYKRAA
jgi:hypothetical protein